MIYMVTKVVVYFLSMPEVGTELRVKIKDFESYLCESLKNNNLDLSSNLI